MNNNNNILEVLFTQFEESGNSNAEYWLNCQLAIQGIMLTADEKKDFLNKVDEKWGVVI